MTGLTGVQKPRLRDSTWSRQQIGKDRRCRPEKLLQGLQTSCYDVVISSADVVEAELVQLEEGLGVLHRVFCDHQLTAQGEDAVDKVSAGGGGQRQQERHGRGQQPGREQGRLTAVAGKGRQAGGGRAADHGRRGPDVTQE